MATIKIPAGTGFSLIPEGKHVFRIYDVEYDADFGKVVLHLVTAKGQKMKETYRLLDKQGNTVSGACNAFAYLAHVALHDFSVDEIDHKDLIGCYIGAEVKHTVADSTKNEGEKVTFQNLGNKFQADGFEEEPIKAVVDMFAPPEDIVEGDDDEDLDALLEGLEDE